MKTLNPFAIRSAQGLGLAVCALACQLSTVSVQAAIAYDESSPSGDLSNSGLAPTEVTLGLGSNEVLGSTGRVVAGGAVDRDYLFFEVPVGLQLSSLKVLSGTSVGGNSAFIGLESGNQLTLPVFPPDATGLLGWHHYGAGDVNTDILDNLGVAVNGSSGFTAPLGAGTYSVWIQDTSVGNYPYGFDFVLEQAPLVPEAGNGVLLVGALGTMIVARRRFAAAS